MSEQLLKGEVALVTGASRMYGRHSAEALADAGAKVYITGTHADTLGVTAEEIRRDCHAEVEPILFHQEDPESIRSVVAEIIAREGRIDVLVSSCRVIPKGPVGWFQEEAGLDWSVKANSAGFLYLTALVGEQMIKQKSGSIISFASMMGLIGIEKHNYDGEQGMADGAYGHDYAVNKSGIIAWTRHAASYYGQYNVRVNSVCPGGIQSDRTPPLFMKNYSDHTQLGRLANNDDIKGPILFLASDASAYLTGLSIPVDGGYTCM